MRIYTKQGDTGLTRLADGERIPKHDHRVELYGTADELNSFIGHALSLLEEKPETSRLRQGLAVQQNLLFELGSELAGFDTGAGPSVIHEEDVTDLEERMDAHMEILEPMRAFILPGGAPASAVLQIARTICRRLERRMTADLSADQSASTVRPLALKYINRLSDYLFQAARMANHAAGIKDVEWHSRAKAAEKKEN